MADETLKKLVRELNKMTNEGSYGLGKVYVIPFFRWLELQENFKGKLAEGWSIYDINLQFLAARYLIEERGYSTTRISFDLVEKITDPARKDDRQLIIDMAKEIQDNYAQLVGISGARHTKMLIAHLSPQRGARTKLAMSDIERRANV